VTAPEYPDAVVNHWVTVVNQWMAVVTPHPNIRVPSAPEYPDAVRTRIPGRP
jgi:hypothetical protein